MVSTVSRSQSTSITPEFRQRCQRLEALASHIPAITHASETITELLEPLHQSEEVALVTLALVLIQNGADKATLRHELPDNCKPLLDESLSLMMPAAAWLQISEKQIEQTDNRLKLLLSTLHDVRAVFVILSAFLFSLQQARNANRDLQSHLAKLAFHAYGPLANRLGIGQLKWELEDYAFRYQLPDEYKSIAASLEEKRIDREQYIRDFVASLENCLKDAGLDAQVYGRPKHIYSIWRKMKMKDLSFDELFDVRAVRVIVKDIAQCYSALSLVHANWPYLRGEYDDYIAAPKSNGYQSLHTAVTGPQDRVVEIQIRTAQMHDHAELGVAAHWRYKEGSRHASSTERQLDKIRALLEGQPDVSDDTHESEIYVLTPEGKVLELVAGATPVDFAYSVHTELGHRCRGAKVNGHMVPLTTALKSGQQVEILTAKEGGPSRDWLLPSQGYVKSSRARSKIRQWFKQQFRDQHIQQGRSSLYRELDQLHIAHSALDAAVARFNVEQLDDLFAAVGRGELGAQQVVNSLRRPAEEPEQPDFVKRSGINRKRGSQDIVIEGVDDLMSHLSRCCKPVPGDPVTGYITRGRGVAIHRQSCINLKQLKDQHPDRILQVHWVSEQGQYEVDLEVVAMDRSGLLRDVSSVLSAEDINLLAANTYSNRKTMQANMRLTIEIDHPEKLSRVLSKLMQLQGMLEVRRVR